MAFWEIHTSAFLSREILRFGIQFLQQYVENECVSTPVWIYVIQARSAVAGSGSAAHSHTTSIFSELRVSPPVELTSFAHESCMYCMSLVSICAESVCTGGLIQTRTVLHLVWTCNRHIFQSEYISQSNTKSKPNVPGVKFLCVKGAYFLSVSGVETSLLKPSDSWGQRKGNRCWVDLGDGKT